MAQRVFVTGASGFVGTAVLNELAARGFAIHALSRSGKLKTSAPNVTVIQGDLFEKNVLSTGLAGCDAVIHLVGIIREEPAKDITFQRIHVEGTERVIDAMQRAGIRRLVHMSALGTRPSAATVYHQTKHAAEEAVERSALDWTIIRPSMIHGPGGELSAALAKWAKGEAAPYLFMPYFGRGLLGMSGAGKLQPVLVSDVARAFVNALDRPDMIGQIYEIGGAEVLTWPELHHRVAEKVIGKRKLVMPIPAWYAKALTGFLPASWLPFNRDQVIMSQEDNTCDLSKFKQDFGWTPIGFSQAVETYALG